MGDQPIAGTNPAQVLPKDATFTVRATTPEDAAWIDRLLHHYWAGTQVYAKGRVIDAKSLPGFAAFRDDEPVGLVTYLIEGDQCQIVTHNSLAGSGGIGSCLLAAVRQEARHHGCKRLWLMVTNDNTPALHFYQRRDFNIVGFLRDSIREGRKLKTSLPDRGRAGIPVRHEFELEFAL